MALNYQKLKPTKNHPARSNATWETASLYFSLLRDKGHRQIDWTWLAAAISGTGAVDEERFGLLKRTIALEHQRVCRVRLGQTIVYSLWMFMVSYFKSQREKKQCIDDHGTLWAWTTDGHLRYPRYQDFWELMDSEAEKYQDLWFKMSSI